MAMNTAPLTLGFSPCPNDTFLFEAMVFQKVDTEGLQFEPITEDVETLNLWAERGKLDITKISFHALLSLGDIYGLLQTGSALGRGVGPLLVGREKRDLAALDQTSIAIPGLHTTAHLLLSLAFPQAQQKTVMPFDQIEDALVTQRHDLGVIIHENRFTYAQKGLVKLMDLGQWWEEKTGGPIPLGGIALHRRHNQDLAQKLDRVMRRSLDYAWKQYPEISSYVRTHAQAMDPGVMRQHIELYVNDYSRDLGTEGRAALAQLRQSAEAAGLVSPAAPSFFF